MTRAATLNALPGSDVQRLADGSCEGVTERCPHEKHRIAPCEEVAGTKDATQTEFWKYKQYIPFRYTLYGAPLSPWHKNPDLYVIVGAPGNQAMCDARRVQIKKPRGVAGDDDDIWADPCFGPFYFRHVPPEAEAAKR